MLESSGLWEWIEPISDAIAVSNFASNLRSNAELLSTFRVSGEMRRTRKRLPTRTKGSGAREGPKMMSLSCFGLRGAPSDQFQPEGTRAFASRTISPPFHRAIAINLGRPRLPPPFLLRANRSKLAPLGRLEIRSVRAVVGGTASG